MQSLKQEQNPPNMKLFDDPAEAEQIWAIRKSGLGATARAPGLGITWEGWEDTAVPPDKLGDYLREFRALLEKHHYGCSLYGHFGDGVLHVRIDFDFTSHEGIDNFMRFIDEGADLVVKYGGSFTAEHGDGQAKGIFLPKLYGEELMEGFRRFKSIWDPEWKMNPGKKIDPNPPDADLRLGADYQPWEPETHFQYPEDEGSFASAALRCVGVGKCRRTDDAFMCPSFLATREEKDTTRGRARMLFDMLNGGVIKDGWRSKEVLESLDLCLGCKGCKTDCPVSVDMATYKSEFLSHHYAGRLRPRAFYAMGLIGWTARLGSLMPGVANFFSQAPGVSDVLKMAGGVARDRPLPAFARRTFRQWFRQRAPGRVTGPPVVLYPDAFNNHFYPQTLQSATEVLERLGYQVLVPVEGVPCVRPLIHYGMLKLAKRELRKAVTQLQPYVREGIPIVGLEPSTVAVFREELLNLMPHDQDGKRVNEKFSLLGEFLDAQEVELPHLDARAILHEHCHHKAVLDKQATQHVLQKMGVEFQIPQVGCCGMAGSFGFEQEHYDISQQIGEMHLMPAVREASKQTLVIAEGFSCRTQVRDFTDRHPMHLAEVIQMAFEENPDTPRGAYPEMPYTHVDAPRMSGTAAGLIGAGLVGGLIASGVFARYSR